MLKSSFMGTSRFAVPLLKALHEKVYPVLRVFTKPDAKKNRGRSVQASFVKKCTQQLNLPCMEPVFLNTKEIEEVFRSLHLDLVVVVSYGLFIPENLLKIPRYGFINVHPSLLPKYRGASPIQTALSNGDCKTGVSLMRLTKEMDAGPVCLQKSEIISAKDNFESLQEKLILSSVQLLLECFNRLEKFSALPFFEQYHEKATYTVKLDRSFSFIDWCWSSKKIFNRIRSLSQPKGGKTFWNEKLLKIFDIDICDDAVLENSVPGKVLSYEKNKGLKIVTGSGCVFVKSLQLESGKCLSVRDFMNGKGHDIVGNLLKKKKNDCF